MKSKTWEQKLQQQKNEDNLYLVTFGESAITARKVNGEYINSVTGEKLKLPNVYRTKKI